MKRIILIVALAALLLNYLIGIIRKTTEPRRAKKIFDQIQGEENWYAGLLIARKYWHMLVKYDEYSKKIFEIIKLHLQELLYDDLNKENSSFTNILRTVSVIQHTRLPLILNGHSSGSLKDLPKTAVIDFFTDEYNQKQFKGKIAAEMEAASNGEKIILISSFFSKDHEPVFIGDELKHTEVFIDLLNHAFSFVSFGNTQKDLTNFTTVEKAAVKTLVEFFDNNPINDYCTKSNPQIPSLIHIMDEWIQGKIPQPPIGKTSMQIA